MTAPDHGFRAEIANGLLVITFQSANGEAPVVGTGLLRGLEELLREADARDDVVGLLFRSGHPGAFLTGPDVREIVAIEDAYRGAELARLGQAVFQRVRQLAVPTVCAIEGACLGAGAELALACDHRIASDSPAVRLGFPQVELGISPGFGGTQRLPHRIGLRAALDLLRTGRRIGAEEARRLGMVDRVVPAGLADRAAVEHLSSGSEAVPSTGPSRGLPVGLRSWERVGPLRRIALYPARQKATGVGRPEHDAAGSAVVEAVEAAYAMPLPQGLDIEARLLGELVSSRTPKNLIRLELDREEVRRRDPGARPRRLRKVAVAGAGDRGSGIATMTAAAGIPVRLYDPDGGSLLAALAAGSRRWDDAVRRRVLTPGERHDRETRLSVSRHFSGFSRADLAVVAVPEDIETVRRILADLERTVADRTVIATASCCIPVDQVAARQMHPERVVGLLFFQPVEDVPLVEVVAGERTSPEAVATARLLALRLGKTPVVVRDHPGTLVNRVRFAYLLEALRMLTEGVAIGVVDEALERFGMAEGPFAHLDRIGLVRARRIAAQIAPVAAEDPGPPLAALDAMIGAGRTGADAGAGFYRYRNAARTSPARETYNLVGVERSRSLPPETLEERLVLTLVREAAACLGDRIVDSPRDVDVAVTDGAGFPAFRGGPLRYADTLGMPAVLDRLERLADALGERFRPVEILRSPPDPRGCFHAAEVPPGPGIPIATGPGVD